jgi:O-antigen ligase
MNENITSRLTPAQSVVAGRTPGPVPRPWAAVVSLGTLTFAFVIPFLLPYHRHPIPTFYSEWIAVVIGLASLFPVLAHSDWKTIPVPPVIVFIIAFIVLLVMQGALGHVTYPGQVLSASLYLLWAATLMVLACILKDVLGETRVVTALAWATLFGAVLSALIGLAQQYGLSTRSAGWLVLGEKLPVFGNIAQRNHFASYCTLGVVSLIYLFATRRLTTATVLLLSVVLVWASSVAGARMVWLFYAALVCLAAFYARKHTRFRTVLVSTALIALLFASAHWLIMIIPVEKAIMTGTGRLLQVESGRGIRTDLWAGAWWTFQQFPLFGAGWGSFSWHHFLFQGSHAEVNIGWVNNAHNVVMHLLAETGIAGCLLFLAGVVVWCRLNLKSLRSVEGWWILGTMSVIGIHSMLEFPLWYSYFLGMLAIAAGLGSCAHWVWKPTPMFRVAVLCMFGFGIYDAADVIGSYRRLEQLYVHAKFREGVISETLASSIQTPLMRPYAELMVAHSFEVSAEDLKEKLDLNTRVMHFAPVDSVVYTQAMLLALDDRPADALHQFSMAMTAYPARVQDIAATLRALSADNPGAFRPLLESAMSRLATRQP